MKPVYIYALSCPITEEIMYIGKTVSPESRYMAHIYTGNSEKWNPPEILLWVKSLLQKGLSPLWHIISICEEVNWDSCERFWISYYRVLSANLLNKSSGGKFPGRKN